MSDRDKKIKAIEFFKNSFPGLTGFRLQVSEANGNEIDFFSEDGLYCTINIRSGKIKNV